MAAKRNTVREDKDERKRAGLVNSWEDSDSSEDFPVPPGRPSGILSEMHCCQITDSYLSVLRVLRVLVFV